MKQLRWQAMHWLRSVGLPGWVALALALACAAGWWGGVVPLRDAAKRHDTDSALLQRRLTERSPTAVAAVRTPQQQLAEFELRFSGEKSLTASLARLHAAARRQGVQLDQAEFKLSSDKREPLARYTIVLPIKADYRALRRFTGEALHELPGLAVEEVNLRRSDPKVPTLDAQLRLVLFVTKAGA